MISPEPVKSTKNEIVPVRRPKSTSSIDTNELTDMDRREDLTMYKNA